jgi:hypothetical protein
MSEKHFKKQSHSENLKRVESYSPIHAHFWTLEPNFILKTYADYVRGCLVPLKVLGLMFLKNQEHKDTKHHLTNY